MFYRHVHHTNTGSTTNIKHANVYNLMVLVLWHYTNLCTIVYSSERIPDCKFVLSKLHHFNNCHINFNVVFCYARKPSNLPTTNLRNKKAQCLWGKCFICQDMKPNCVTIVSTSVKQDRTREWTVVGWVVAPPGGKQFACGAFVSWHVRMEPVGRKPAVERSTVTNYRLIHRHWFHDW